jgi:mono/diheme cytochrome c family protein
MLKALIVGMILGAALLLGGIWMYFTTGRAPVAVTDPPLPFEKKIAHASLNAHLDKQPRTAPAVPADETHFLAGAEVYKQNCAVCHGLPGAAPTNISEGMYPKPPELFKGTGVTDDPAWETYWKAAHGIRLTGMPGFQGRLTDTQLWQVSQLLANADKISPAIKAALTATAPAAPTPANAVVPTK